MPSTQTQRRAAKKARAEQCCVPHCENRGNVTACPTHRICKRCLWGCTKPQCEDGMPFYKCPLCRKKKMLPVGVHMEYMLQNHFFTKECIKESCCDGPRYHWKLEPCDFGCYQCKDACIRIGRLVPVSEASESGENQCDQCGVHVEEYEYTTGPEGETWCHECSVCCERCGTGVLLGEHYRCPGQEGGNEFFCYGCVPEHSAFCSHCPTTAHPVSNGSASPSTSGSAS